MSNFMAKLIGETYIDKEIFDKSYEYYINNNDSIEVAFPDYLNLTLEGNYGLYRACNLIYKIIGNNQLDFIPKKEDFFNLR